MRKTRVAESRICDGSGGFGRGGERFLGFGLGVGWRGYSIVRSAPDSASTSICGSVQDDRKEPTGICGMNAMPFAFSKIFDHGTTHPVVARLHVQTGDLLQMSSLIEEKRQEVFQIIFEASTRLLHCYDIVTKIREARDTCMHEYQPAKKERTITLPHIIGLEGDAENFLYEAKLFLRDLTGLINAVFGTKFGQASDYYSAKSKRNGKIAAWAEESFGADDRLTRHLTLHQDWIGEVVRMRNAVEHPGGKSGVLHVKNFEMMSDGTIRLPVWFRNEEQPSKLVEDMEGICEYLLLFAEELLVFILEKHLAMPFLQIFEIPESARDKQCPKRFESKP